MYYHYYHWISTLFLFGQYAVSLCGASKAERNASLTDLSKCKLTQFGTDYMGSIMTTAGGIRCQMWHTDQPIHKVSEAITDVDFPERSKQLARNYCRNPTKDPRGPWCYTMDSTLIDDDCEVPLCNFGECRISGTGSEYGGTHDTGSSSRKCKSWDKSLKLAINKTEKFSNNRFSDLSRNKAKNFCRNPDSSVGGPWCYVDAEDYDVVEKEYCSVPFCDDKDCLVYTKNASVYSILTSLNSTIGNITLWIKLWNPADEQIGQARILFSHLQVPASAKVIAEEWRAGVEIVIANSGSGQEYPRTDDEADLEDTPTILVGSKWTALWVTWGGGFISVGHQGSTKPLFLDEFKKKNTISSMYPENFFHYGIMGTGVLWSMQFCEDTCEVHTTFGIESLRIWPLLSTNSSHDLQFHVRASHTATVQLMQTPALSFPRLSIVLGKQGATLVIYQEKESSIKEILLDLETKNIINFWAWHEFTISIFGMSIQMFWHRDYGREEVFSVQHHIVQTVRWFSIGTDNTIAHWTLFCPPTEDDAVESPWFPNCVSSSSDARYEGSQWTSENQVPCIPWIANTIPTDYKKDDIFIDGSALKALNKCRNPTNDPEGPFCFTAVQPGGSTVKKQYCPIRKCRSSECRLAGTANDYLGTLSVTRSGRQCIRWVSEFAEMASVKKNISLRSIIARAFNSLKVKRENSLMNSDLDISGRRWDEIGLRSRVPRDTEYGLFRTTPGQYKISEIQTQNEVHKLAKYQEPLIQLDNDPAGFAERQVSKSADDDDDYEGVDLFNLKPATFPKKQIPESTSESPKDDDQWPQHHPGMFRPFVYPGSTSKSPDDDDDDDDGIDLFKLKPATFPKQQISKTTSESPKYDDHWPQHHPGMFRPFVNPASTSQSTDNDDDYEGVDLFKSKPATFPKKQIPESTSESPKDDDQWPQHHSGMFRPFVYPGSTSKSPDDDDDDDDGIDLFKLKPATFPKQQISKTTSESPEMPNHHPGTFRPFVYPGSTSKSPDDDDGIDLFKLKPATFPKQQVSKATSESPEVPHHHPGTFRPFVYPGSTSKSPNDDDDDDDGIDLFKLKPATFPKQQISKTTAESPEKPNHHPGTFRPFVYPGSTSKSPNDDDDDDDDDGIDLFKLKPATFPKQQNSKTTSESPKYDDRWPQHHSGMFRPFVNTAGTSQSTDDDEDYEGVDLFKLKPATFPKKQIPESTSESPKDDDQWPQHHPGMFRPFVYPGSTSKSPDNDDDDDDGIDLFKLKPATFPKQQISKTTSESPEMPNHHPGTFRPFVYPGSTSKSPDDDDGIDLFKLKPATFPKQQISKATSESPEVPHHHPGTFRPFVYPGSTSKSPDDDDDDDDGIDLFKLKPATFPKQQISKTTSESPEMPNHHPGTFRPFVYPGSTSKSPDDDDDDDDGIDLFKLKPATFPKQQISKTTAESPEKPNHHPGTFRPFVYPGSTSKSPDDDDGIDLFKLKPATFPKQQISKATSESPEVPHHHPGTFRPFVYPGSTSKSPNDDDDDDDDDGIDLFKLKPATFPKQQISKTTAESPEKPNHHPGTFRPFVYPGSTSKSPDDDDDDDDGIDLFKLKPATFPKQQILKATSESPEVPHHHPGTFRPFVYPGSTSKSPDDDDDDDDGIDLFKLKPATFPKQQISKTTAESPEKPNHHPGTFRPFVYPGSTSKSPDDDDDDDDGIDLFKLKPATFPKQQISKATSESPEVPHHHPGTFRPFVYPGSTSKSPNDDDDDDDGIDLFKLKPATFPKQQISKTTAESPEKPNHHPGTFRPFVYPGSTSKSPDDDDDDDDGIDLFKLKPATFPKQQISKTTAESPEKPNHHPGTSRPFVYPGSTSKSPDDDDDDDDGIDLFKLKPATFPKQQISKTTAESPEMPNHHPGTFRPFVYPGSTSKSPDDDDDDDDGIDLFKLKPATFPKQQISKTTAESPEKPNHHPGTFRPFVYPGSTSKSPDDDDDDDDGIDLFKLKPATFPKQQISKATSESPEVPHHHPGTFRPFVYPGSTSKSPNDDDDDDDDDDDGIDLFKLKPATFPKQQISKTTAESPEKPNHHPGTFRPFVYPGSTSKSPDDDDDDDDGIDLFKLKPATFPKNKISKTTSQSPEMPNHHPGTFRPYGNPGSTSQPPATTDDDNDDGVDLFKSKPATSPKKQFSRSTPESSEAPNYRPGTFRPYNIPGSTSAEDLSLLTLLPPVGNIPRNLTFDEYSKTTQHPQSTEGNGRISTDNNTSTTPTSIVDPRYLNDTLYPEQNARNASNFCRNPSRNIAGTWCYTSDPEVPQDLCNVRDCEQPEECIFLVRGQGTGRRLYVLPEYRSEGLHFSLKEWEPDHPDSITFVILSEDDVQSRFILKVGAMKNEKVLLYYETKEAGIKLVKEKTLPHLLYLGKWTGFVIRMDRGGIKLYYEGAPYPLFEWEDPEPAKAFLPIYYYYSSELGNSIGVAFNCDTKCHIEQTTTDRFTRILPISIWLKEETPSPGRLVLMLRGEGVVLLPLLMLPTVPSYYALTIGESGQWIFFIKNKHPMVHILHKQDAGGPLFTPNTWTNLTIEFYNYTMLIHLNGTEIFNYVHNLPLLFYFFSLAVDKGGWVTWAANCVPIDIDGDPLDGGWSEWGPWTCSASCNGGMGVRKRTCDNPEPNIRGQPCLGPSTSSGLCNMNKCGDIPDVTLELIKKRIRIQHTSIIINEGDGVTLSADADIVSTLRNETPSSEINWSRNGIFLEEEEDRVKIEDTAVSISYTVVNDSGVYTQTLHRVDDSHIIFKIITLAVVPLQSDIEIRETLPFSVTCHCVVLGYVYSDLKVSWILNGKVFKDYGVSTPVAVNVDYIPKANVSHHGEWRCEVVQSDLNFKWTTNVITVTVLGPPNWRTHLMEDKLTSPIFGWMPNEGFVAFSAFFLTTLIIGAIVGSTIWYLRFRESLKWKDPQKEKLINNEEKTLSESENEQLLDKKKRSE